MKKRIFKLIRKTKETNIFIKLNLDGTGISKINTKMPFFNHMINQFVFYSLIDLELNAIGDLYIDQHHTIEDIGITLGKCFYKAIGDKKNISRYGFAYVPLDESLSRVIVDISGRSKLIYKINFDNNIINDFDLNLIKEFFISFVNNSFITLHIDNLRGKNIHHKFESIFKALGIAFKKAIKISNLYRIPSTKGIL